MARVLAIVLSSYPSDVRVRREAETLVEAGFAVDLICYRKAHQPEFEKINGVRVFRLPMRRKRAGKLRYLWEYISFTVRSMRKAAQLSREHSYGLVHVHNMPDLLVFSAWFPRRRGARVLLDLHDPMPEVYRTKYGLPEHHPVIRALKWLERQSIRFADQVITPNTAFRDLFIARGCPPEKIGIVMNTPMERLLKATQPPGPGRNRAAALKIMFHGTIVERHGLLTALKALTILRPHIPGLAFEVYGNGNFVQPFQRHVAALGLQSIVRYHGFVPNETIIQRIAEIDLGIIPNEDSPFTRLNLPVRIFEYLALKKPVIVPKTPGILDYFSENNIHFFEAGNPESLAGAILNIYLSPESQNGILQRGYAIYQQHCWENQKRYFIDLIQQLLGSDLAAQPVPDRQTKPLEEKQGC